MVKHITYLIDIHINSPDIYVGVGDALYQYRALAHFDFGFQNFFNYELRDKNYNIIVQLLLSGNCIVLHYI